MILAVVFGYLLGSIPFGLLLTRAAGAGDLRALGSGSIGATNVLRTGRRDLAAATLLLDGGKGAAAYWLAGRFVPEIAPIYGPVAAVAAGVAAMLGHLFPVWLRFRGGKGIATGFGILLAFDWRVGLLAALTWAAAVAITRMSSAGGLSASAAAPVFAQLLGGWREALLPLTLAVLVWFKHASNIRRLIAGTEPRIGQ